MSFLIAVIQALCCAIVAYVSFDINIACLTYMVMFNILLILYNIENKLNNNKKQ